MAATERPWGMADAFEAVSASPRLAGVACSQGAEELDKLGAAPRIVWVPSEDPYGAADTLGDQPYVLEGRRVQLESIALRHAGCDIHLFTTGRDTAAWRAAEDLLRRFLLALRDALDAYGNYAIGRARWSPRGAISTQTTEVLQPITVYVPIWDDQPAQLVGAVQTNLRG